MRRTISCRKYAFDSIFAYFSPQEEDGDTLLTSLVVDDAALHGLLKKVRDLGLPLLSINRLKTDQTEN